ncbi:MAG: hypothetical protein ACFFEN_05540 [Candidatus Thorarchaeota archaeon]
MCAKFRGIPALIYSGLWRRQIFNKLSRDFPNSSKLVIYITDQPPAVLVKILNGKFEMEKLEDLNNISDIEKIECDSYFAAPLRCIYGGFEALKKGLDEGKVKMKNETIIFSILLRNLS